MSQDFDFDADLAALLAPSESVQALQQPEHQEAAAAAPDLDLAALLDPAQVEPATDVVIDDFTAGQAAVLPAVESHLVELAAIAARRDRHDAEVRRLGHEIETGQSGALSARQLDQLIVMRYLAALRSKYTEWEAFCWARDHGMAPGPKKRPSDWTPFQLLGGHNP